MNCEEIVSRDVIIPGGVVVTVESFKDEYPEWFSKWRIWEDYELDSKYKLISDMRYGISGTVNAVYSLDFSSLSAELSFSFEDDCMLRLHHAPIRIDSIMFFPPSCFSKWAYYDLEKKTWFYQELLVDQESPFTTGVKSWMLLGESVFFLHGATNIISRLDVRTYKVETFHLSAVSDRTANLSSYFIRYKDSVLVFAIDSNRVLEVDLNDMRIKNTYYVGGGISGIISAFWRPDLDDVLIIGKSSSGDVEVYSWNVESGRINYVLKAPMERKSAEVNDPRVVFCYSNWRLFVMSLIDTWVVEIDLDNYKTWRISILSDFNMLDRSGSYYGWGDGITMIPIMYDGHKEMTTFLFPYDYSLAEIDFDNGGIVNRRKWKVYGSEHLIRSSLKSFSEGVHLENDYYGVGEFLFDLEAK